ncbi:MAG: NAD(P)H-dependent oxidoreductase [Pseudomonadota bacterium]|nr:NAD(P)H-dependent oxidoreductase [Pseudomonadota bacterium]
MKHLLIVYHSKTGHTAALVEAARRGATDESLDPVELRCLTASAAGADDLLWADGLILATPENFGYMSGALKDFLDRTFYEVEGKLLALPYALLVGAGNDGTGAIRAIERIANGYPFIKVQEPVISRLASVDQSPDQDVLTRCREIGMTMAAGLALEIF